MAIQASGNKATTAAKAEFNEGWRLAQADRVEEASVRFKRAAEICKKDTSLVLEFCSRLTAMNYDYEAIEILREASRREPQSQRIWMTLANALAKVWQLKAAIPAYETAMSVASPNASDLLAYAKTLFTARQPEAANRILKRARILGANDPGTIYLQARCESLMGNRDRERKLAQDAIRAKRDFGSAWELLLDTTGDEDLQGFADECLHVAGAKTIRPNDKALVLYAAGRALDRLGSHAQAFSLFERANRIQAGDARDRGLTYDRDDVDQFLDQIQADFRELNVATLAGAPDRQPIFIVGMVRSGTSVIEQVMGGLDGVVMGGESEAMEVVAGKYYWAASRGRAKEIKDLTPGDWASMAREYWRHQAVPESRVTDKAPLNFRHIGLVCAMFPQSPVIYVRRDPRDVGLSVFSRYFSDAHFYATDLKNIAHFTSASERMMAYWTSRFPGRILGLQFEEFLSGPDAVSKRLADFCGLKWKPDCLRFHERNDASYTFSEAQVREPLSKKGVGRWSQYEHQLAPLIEALSKYGVTVPQQ